MRKTKEKRPTFITVDHRPLHDGHDDKVRNIDNHRSERFGGYAHDIPAIITENELFKELQEMAKELEEAAKSSKPIYSIGSALDAYSVDTTRSTGKGGLYLAFSLAARNSASWRHVENPEGLPSHAISGLRKSEPTVPIKFDEKIYSDFTPKGLDFIDQIALQNNVSRDYIITTMNNLERKFALEKEQKRNLETWNEEHSFRRRASWRVMDEAVNPDWIAAQTVLKPSLLDESELGSFDEWMDFTPASTQYLLMGDTNHFNEAIAQWLGSGEFLKKLKEKGFNDIVIERPASFNHDYRRLNNGEVKASDVNINSFNDQEFLQEAQRLGIRVHAFDRQIVAGDLSEEEKQKIYFSRHENEQYLADDIKAATGDRKTAVIYGSSHFSYKHGLADLLGREKSRHVNIHASLEDYHNPYVLPNAEVPAPYVYLIEEKAVIEARGNYEREISPARDKYLCLVVIPTEQRKEVEKFTKSFEIECRAFPEKYKGITVEDVVARAKQRRDNEGRYNRDPSGMLGCVHFH